MTMMQPRAAEEMAEAGGEWTSERVDRSGAAAYVHLVRGADDPEEMPRGATSERQERWGVAPHRLLDSTRKGQWTGPILKLVREQPGLTFNAISVTLTGLTADVAFGTPLDDALWALVERGLVEHTMAAPIRWRATSAGADAAGLEDVETGESAVVEATLGGAPDPQLALFPAATSA